MAPKNRKKKVSHSASGTATNNENSLRKYSEETTPHMSFVPMLPVDGDRRKIAFSKKHTIPVSERPKASKSVNSGTNGSDELLKRRKRSMKSITDLPTIPEGGCNKDCKRKGKSPVCGSACKMKGDVINEESERESCAEDKNEAVENETEECDPECGQVGALGEEGSDHRGDLCHPLCCPPNARSETELLEEFVAQLLADAETSSVTAPECLCEEVTRWMRYFMCGCDLNKDATTQLADAVAEADSRIPGLLKALTDELRAQAEKAREQPKDRKLVPEEQRVRWYVAAKALRAVKFLDEAYDRWRLAAALKVAADMAAAEYEEILRKQLDVMMELLQKRLEKDWKVRTRPYLVDLSGDKFFRRTSRASL